jgi:hypothetical protein
MAAGPGAAKSGSRAAGQPGICCPARQLWGGEGSTAQPNRGGLHALGAAGPRRTTGMDRGWRGG